MPLQLTNKLGQIGLTLNSFGAKQERYYELA